MRSNVTKWEWAVSRPELYILGSKQVKYATSEQTISQNNGRSNKYLTDWPQEKKNHLNLKPTDQDYSNHVTQRLGKHPSTQRLLSAILNVPSPRASENTIIKLASCSQEVCSLQMIRQAANKLRSNLFIFINIKLPLMENLPEELRYRFPRATALQKSFHSLQTEENLKYYTSESL